MTRTTALKQSLPLLIDIEGLLPPRYRRYAPVLAQALTFFIGELKSERRQRILAGQLSLGARSSPEARLVALMRHCPTLHKLGQVVARDRRLSVDLRKRLQSLEVLPPAVSHANIVAVLRHELGDSLVGEIELEERPLAEASVAVVTPFRYRRAVSNGPRHGVLKVLKPGIEAKLDEEAAVWSKLGSLLDEICEDHELPALDYRDTLENVVDQLRREVCLESEQRHLRDARARYEDSGEVVVPRVLSPCTSRVTAMERVHGVKVTEGPDVLARRQRLGATLVRELLARPFWDTAPKAVFHGDPHAGNLLLDDTGRVALLDWSLTTELDKRERIAIVQIVLGALTLDAVRIRRSLRALARDSCDESLLAPIVSAALKRLRWGEIPGLVWLTDLLDQSLLQGSAKFSANLTVFRKVLLTLSGVLEDLSSSHVRDAVLVSSGLQQLLSEWTRRLAGSMSTRQHGSHVSNEDLLGLWANAPLTAGSFWLSVWADTIDLLRSQSLRT